MKPIFIRKLIFALFHHQTFRISVQQSSRTDFLYVWSKCNKMYLTTPPRRRLKKHLLLFPIIISISIAMSILFLYIFNETKPLRTEIRLAVLIPSEPEVIVSLNLKTFGAAEISTTVQPTFVNNTAKLSEITSIDNKQTVLSKGSHWLSSTHRNNPLMVDHLQALKIQSIREQRELIAYEMEGYNFTGNNNATKKSSTILENLIIEKGGEPMRNLVFATWRSGSTFMGDLLNSHPGTFYHYEPLLHMKVKQVRSKKEARDAIKIVSHLLSCNYTDIDEFNRWQQYESQERNQQNKRVWRFCRRQRKICEDPNFLSDMCKLFPFQSMKTVRMRLRLGKELLENKQLNNLRILLLVRDPRGVMQSRQHRDWCFRGKDCIQPDILCKDMEEDFKYAEIFRKQYPDRFLALRYEDISLHPFSATKKIFNFFRLQVHPDVNYFLQTHTVKNHGGVTSTFRDSRQTPFQWAHEIYGDNFSALDIIQASCSEIMLNWGYPLVSNKSELLSFSQIGIPPWPDMIIN